MTAGAYPYAWLQGSRDLLFQRRRSKEPVPIPGSTISLPGLLNKTVVEAAALDGQRVPWSVLPDTPLVATIELVEGARRVMAACMAAGASDRPKLPALMETLRYH